MQNINELRRYEDIIHLKRPVSRTHPPMPVSDRAAQFAPFAALTGYGDAVKETERLTEDKVELSDSKKEELDAKLQYIREHIKELPQLQFTFFEADSRKEGGAYRTITGNVKKLDAYRRVIVLSDGTKIPAEDILELTING